jgi:hypothetical protein
MPAAPGLFGDRTFPGTRRGKGGKFLVQLAGTAMRTLRPFPVGGADEDFAVALTLFAMEFVNWHAGKISGPAKNSSRRISPFLSTANN